MTGQALRFARPDPVGTLILNEDKFSLSLFSLSLK